ncbi:MAG: CoA-binding protein [Pirellulaceae bacterium]
MDSAAKFLSASSFAVAGASRNQAKYGSKVFAALVNSGRVVYPINPSADTIGESIAYPNLAAIPSVPVALSIVTPPEVTKVIIEEAVNLGVEHIWMQPGAEHEEASALARQSGINVIDDGSCILVLLALGTN